MNRGMWGMIIKHLIVAWVGAFALSAQPLMVSTNFNSIDFSSDGTIEAKYEAGVSLSGQGASLQVGVGSMVVAEFGVAALRMSAADLYFGEGDPISRDSPLNGAPPPLTSTARLVAYAANQNRFLEWLYVEGSPVDSPGDRLTVYIGLRFPAAGGLCHGWLKFVRPDAQLPTLFTLDSYDWNPIPGEPIRAGFPPDIPIQPEWLPDGETLRFTWPAALSNWVLESTPNLEPPIVWEPAESAGGHADIATTEEGRFFRLRRP